MSLEDRLNYWDPLYLHLRLLISRSLCICIVSGREVIYIFGNLFIPCICIYVVFWKSKSGFQYVFVRSYLHLQRPLYLHLRLSKSEERFTPLRASVLSVSILASKSLERDCHVRNYLYRHLRIYASTFIRKW